MSRTLWLAVAVALLAFPTIGCFSWATLSADEPEAIPTATPRYENVFLQREPVTLSVPHAPQETVQQRVKMFEATAVSVKDDSLQSCAFVAANEGASKEFIAEIAQAQPLKFTDEERLHWQRRLSAHETLLLRCIPLWGEPLNSYNGSYRNFEWEGLCITFLADAGTIDENTFRDRAYGIRDLLRKDYSELAWDEKIVLRMAITTDEILRSDNWPPTEGEPTGSACGAFYPQLVWKLWVPMDPPDTGP
jgi:hypothetical protein